MFFIVSVIEVRDSSKHTVAVLRNLMYFHVALSHSFPELFMSTFFLFGVSCTIFYYFGRKDLKLLFVVNVFGIVNFWRLLKYRLFSCLFYDYFFFLRENSSIDIYHKNNESDYS